MPKTRSPFLNETVPAQTVEEPGEEGARSEISTIRPIDCRRMNADQDLACCRRRFRCVEYLHNIR